jgi:hypothetical protein
MTTLAQRIVSLATAIGGDIKTLTNAQGSLSALTTTAQNNLVAAINEIKAALDAGGGGGVTIDDTSTTSTTQTYSVSKIQAVVEAAKTAVKNELVNGAASALDTLNELAAALGNDASFSTTVANALAARLRFDAAQTLTTTEQNTACGNLGIGNPDTDFVSTYNTAKA